ncbi:hypothetical protein N431DRAFT_429499 [Stipitochalara longipes BDJ]|nr:hypothetical protein N431DRAFT_429499 [Stipitochalara longipes BDJ]
MISRTSFRRQSPSFSTAKRHLAAPRKKSLRSSTPQSQFLTSHLLLLDINRTQALNPKPAAHLFTSSTSSQCIHSPHLCSPSPSSPCQNPHSHRSPHIHPCAHVQPQTLNLASSAPNPQPLNQNEHATGTPPRDHRLKTHPAKLYLRTGAGIPPSSVVDKQRKKEEAVKDDGWDDGTVTCVHICSIFISSSYDC